MCNKFISLCLNCYVSYKHRSKDEVHSLSWEEIWRDFDFPHVQHMIDLVLSLSASSSEAGRGFLAMKLTKTNGLLTLILKFEKGPWIFSILPIKYLWSIKILHIKWVNPSSMLWTLIQIVKQLCDLELYLFHYQRILGRQEHDDFICSLVIIKHCKF